jgi:hypothetical protein
MMRIHITWSGKARDLPRLSEVYADTAAAIGLRLRRDLPDEAIHTRLVTHKAAGTSLCSAVPAATSGSAA